MTALAYVENHILVADLPDRATLHCGGGCALFTSGSAPTGVEMSMGQQTGLFTTSCAPSGALMMAGDLVELYTTSC